MAKWKQERLPPPRVNQSEYDKVGLTRKSVRKFDSLVFAEAFSMKC